MFADRVDAGRQLADKLEAYAGAADAVVLGIPRGGVVVAAQVARALRLPLGVVVAAKVGSPHNPEFAIGAVTADGEVIANTEAGFSHRVVEEYSEPAAQKAARLLADYRRIVVPIPLAGCTAIVVDDGLATGLTARAAVAYVRHQGAASVVLAVPVASPSAASGMSADVDELVALDVPPEFSAVGQFYRRFDQTPDGEVERLLRDASGRPASP